MIYDDFFIFSFQAPTTLYFNYACAILSHCFSLQSNYAMSNGSDGHSLARPAPSTLVWNPSSAQSQFTFWFA